MARTDMQRESFRQLEWALSFSESNLTGLSKDEIKRPNYELSTFVQKTMVEKSDLVPNFHVDQLRWIKSEFKQKFADLANLMPFKDQQLSSASFFLGEAIEIVSMVGKPYTQTIRAKATTKTLVLAALAGHLLLSGIVGGQIRRCPECDKIFLLKLRPRPNREFHCSIKCTNRATFRRFKEKQAKRRKRK